ncbi:hypothetical protein BGZ83_009563 [Gryganskiella cystojenkinii]|nr:hypothetical protein BGZ83_009563 [Gryganskiella cystojenkinii]
MDFFAQAYNRSKSPGNINTGSGAKVSPLHSPRTPYVCEGVGQGYGCEANAHLRRASSGLECDIGPGPYAFQHQGGLNHGYGDHNHNQPSNALHHQQHHRQPSTPRQGRSSGGVASPAMKTTHQAQNEDSYFSSAVGSSSAFDARSPTQISLGTALTPGSPMTSTPHRRTSVSNPCLLHHTNAHGGGAVRPPVMPYSLSSPRLTDDPVSLDEQQQSNNSSNNPGGRHSRDASHVHQPSIEEGRELYF